MGGPWLAGPAARLAARQRVARMQFQGEVKNAA